MMHEAAPPRPTLAQFHLTPGTAAGTSLNHTRVLTTNCSRQTALRVSDHYITHHPVSNYHTPLFSTTRPHCEWCPRL